jgi:peptidoglycan/LPS O-acetylase OafA/YrhL
VRNPHIDLLRGLSILAVLIGHSLRFGGYWVEIFPEWTRVHFIEGAYHGVTIFFVVSGFLITRKFIGENGALRIDARRFYIQRMGRIIPPLLLLIVTSSAFAILALGADWNAANIARGIFALCQLDFGAIGQLIPHTNSAFDPLWSLAIEETFYVFLPVLCILLVTKSRLVIALGIAVLAGLSSRYLFSNLYSFSGTFDQLAIGGLTAIFAPLLTRHTPGMLRWIRSASLTSIIALWFCADIHNPLSQTAIALAAATYLAASIQSNSKSLLVLQPIESFGFLSYEIYLFHMMVMPPLAPYLLEWRVPFSAINFLPSILVFGAVYAVGWIIERVVSRRANKFIRGLHERNARPAQFKVVASQMAE